MGSIYNLQNEVNQTTIFPKEIVKIRKFILEFRRSDGS